MALAQLQEFELKTDGGNCPDNLEREIESLKKSKAHYAKLKFEIYDDYTKTNITRDQMAKKTAEVKQKIAEIESLITEKQETLDMQKDLFLDAKQEQLTKLSKLDGIEKKPFPYLLCVTNMLLHDIEVPNIYHMNSLRHNVLDYTEKDKFDVILMNPPYGGHEDKSIQGFFPDDLASSETADLFMSVIMYRLKKNGRAAVVLPDGFLFGTDNTKVAIKKKLISEFNLHTVIRLPHSVFAPYKKRKRAA